MMISTEKISHHSTPHFRKSWVGRNLMFWLPCHICENIIFLGRVDIFLKPTELRHILDFRILFICKESHEVSSCSSPERVVRIWSLLLWNCDTLSSLTHAPGSGQEGGGVWSQVEIRSSRRQGVVTWEVKEGGLPPWSRHGPHNFISQKNNKQDHKCSVTIGSNIVSRITVNDAYSSG